MSLYNEKIMEHFVNPKNLGKIKNPDAKATVGNPQCGDVFSLYLKIDKDQKNIDDSKIADIKFETLGCVAAISVSSMVTEVAKGKTLEQAEKLKFEDINRELGFLPPVKVHCAQMAIRALRKAIENYRIKNKELSIKTKIMKLSKKLLIKLISINALVALVVGFVGGVLAYDYVRPWVMNQRGESVATNQFGANTQNQISLPANPETTQEAAVMSVVKNVSPSVVSIFIYKNMPVYSNSFDPWNFFQPFQQKQQGIERREIGGGTGFVISKNLIATNKHVASDQAAEYEVVTNDGQKYSAQILAQDPFNDLAILKVENLNLSVLTLGDSDNLRIGQSVIAIGNALGEFRNTVSVGVISGLSRSVQAGSGLGGAQETLEELIQTDAAINSGNSGGPLLNLKGEVIGINTAKASGADNIGFALPINKAKKVINDVIKNGKISYPFLGVRFLAINAAIKQANNLPVDYGVLIARGQNAGEVAIAPGSAADKAGLQENDIILEVNGVKIDENNSLPKLLQKYSPGQTITLKIWHQGVEKTISATLGEYSQ